MRHFGCRFCSAVLSTVGLLIVHIESAHPDEVTIAGEYSSLFPAVFLPSCVLIGHQFKEVIKQEDI